ncbi:hypothetical protein ZEAMMB73_Zm00001d016929 [Zea mays]|uniref:Uncharacterized protein n=1 Tax=Zea mays TaxID=4577 RepID=A0A1D6HBB2_MAIZE|nr:hypothetical protein ZEAMMB73_Zm00001d016929 [Zea mays]
MLLLSPSSLPRGSQCSSTPSSATMTANKLELNIFSWNSSIGDPFIFETQRHNGIRELCPTNGEHKLIRARALIPLHEPNSVAINHQWLHMGHAFSLSKLETGQELLDMVDSLPIVAIKSLKVSDFQGAHIIVAHMGLTTAGSIGAMTAATLDDSVLCVQAIADAAFGVKLISLFSITELEDDKRKVRPAKRSCGCPTILSRHMRVKYLQRFPHNSLPGSYGTLHCYATDMLAVGHVHHALKTTHYVVLIYIEGIEPDAALEALVDRFR